MVELSAIATTVLRAEQVANWMAANFNVSTRREMWSIYKICPVQNNAPISSSKSPRPIEKSSRIDSR